MKINSVVFETSAPDLKRCPARALPEFAFIGRSNVGKSSLVNLLAGQRALAHVSDTPGKTKLINFYLVNGRWSLVDLPGYGYAHVSQTERTGFNAAVAEFIEERGNLARVFVLIDSRLPPQAIDLEFVRWLGRSHADYALVFTKTDKQSAAQSQANIAAFKARIARWRTEMPEIFLSSAKSQRGRREILGCIEAVLAAKNRATE
jgi:GTP-binding protein